MTNSLSARRICAATPVCVLLSVIAGCGGGGGSGGSSSNPAAGMTLSLSTNSASFAAFSPAYISQPQSVHVNATVAGSGEGTLYVIVTPSNPAVATVADVMVSSTGGSARIVPGPAAALGVGLHTATITVQACLNSPGCTANPLNGSPQTITVNYAVNGMSSSASSLTFPIGNAAQPSDFTRSFSVNAYPAGGWTATTDIPLLDVTPTGGGAAVTTAVTASVDPSRLDEYGGGQYTGSIRFQANNNPAVRHDVPVTLNITRTRVNFVAPYAVPSGRSGEVVVRGESFSAAPPTGVLFGAVSASSFTVVSDTEIRATHPALAPGDYVVHVTNAQGIDRTNARLHVYEAPAYAAGAIGYPDGPSAHAFDMIYDAERKALIVNVMYNSVGVHTNQLVRYAHTAAGWAQTARIFIPSRSALALSQDGRRLLLARPAEASMTFSVDELDPVSLAVHRTTTRPSAHEGFSMAVANDGNALIGVGSSCCTGGVRPVLKYSPLRRSISTVSPPGPINVIPPPVLEGETVAASGDGSLVLAYQSYYARLVRYVSGSDAVQYFDAQQTPDVQSIGLNRRGTLVLISNRRMYDAAFLPLGELPNTIRSSVIAPELPRVYAYDESGEVRLFDASLPAQNGMLVEMTPALVLGENPGSVIHARQMLVTPDGGTLFIAGRDQIVVQPL